jgi:hypothetical protein
MSECYRCTTTVVELMGRTIAVKGVVKLRTKKAEMLQRPTG